MLVKNIYSYSVIIKVAKQAEASRRSVLYSKLYVFNYLQSVIQPYKHKWIPQQRIVVYVQYVYTWGYLIYIIIGPKRKLSEKIVILAERERLVRLGRIIVLQS